MARAGTPDLQPAVPLLTNPGLPNRQKGLKPSLQPDTLPLSSYAYTNDLPRRRETNVLNQSQKISEDQRQFDDKRGGAAGRPSPASTSIAVPHDLDANGKPVAAYAYDPFGNVTGMAGAEAAENEWRFSTKPVEAGTGWLYYGYRWYDTGMGRWVNRDPIEESGGVNLYGFVGNDGVNGIDSLGKYMLRDADHGCRYPYDDVTIGTSS